MHTIEDIHGIFDSCGSVCTDSRKVIGTPLFIALSGPSFNGNKFAAQALESGCSYAVVDEEKYKLDDRYILVSDALQTLQDLAQFHRQQYDIPIIGLTGSNGKTTTKELIKAILSVNYKVTATQGNLNNHIGVPLSLLQLTNETDIGIMEMGTNSPGEINALCEIAMPTHGLITSIGKAHLEGLGSIEGVAKEKLSLFDYVIKHHGDTFYPTSDPFIQQYVDTNSKLSYGYNISKFSKCTVTSTSLFPSIRAIIYCSFQEEEILISPLFGKHNLLNIAAALTLGAYFEVPLKQSVKALASLRLNNNRAEVIERGSNTIILDAYNANPSSMSETIKAFGETDTNKKILIIGDMYELGAYTNVEHQHIVNLVSQFDWYKVILVGKHFYECEYGKEVQAFPDYSAVKLWFDLQDFKNKNILIKASRGLALERLIHGSAH